MFNLHVPKSSQLVASELSRIKDIQWDQDFLSLPSLDDRPFDLLDVIKENQTQDSPRAPESVTTSISQDNLTEIEYEREDEEDDDDAWTRKAARITTFNALSWDTRSQHFPTLEQKNLARKHISTPFLSEAPISVFDSVIQSRTSGPQQQPIDQADLAKGLTSALIGAPSIYVHWYRDAFQLRKTKMRILGVSTTALQSTIHDILSFATNLKKLETVALACKQSNRYGLTGVAMGCCLLEFYLNIQQQLDLLFEKEDRLTILSIAQYTTSLSTIIQKLCRLVCIGVPLEELSDEQKEHIEQHGFYMPFGIDIINLLHAEIQQFDLVSVGNEAFYRDICLSVLQYVSVPFQHMLSQWLGLESLYNGRVDDPHQEFFITENIAIKDILKRYDIRPYAQLPYFINDHFAIYILRSGVSLQLLKRSTPTHPIFKCTQSIPLKFLPRNLHSDSYMTSILGTCERIQTYNTGSMGIEPLVNDTLQLSLEEEEENTTLSTPLELTFLDPNQDLKGDFLQTLTQLIQHQQQATDFIPTLDTIIDQSYTQPLQLWCPLLNQSFMSSFLHRYKLQSHLVLLFDHFLFGSATFVVGLENTFFKTNISLTHHRQWPPRSHELDTSLRDLLIEDGEEQSFSFSFREDKETSPWLNPNSVEALDFLQLDYHASYPLNIVITPPIIEKYNRIFTFVLQLVRTHTVTKRMFMALRNIHWFRPNTRDTISRFRSGLEQFISAVQGYVHDTAILHTWTKFMQHVHGLQYNKQNEYVSAIMEPHTFKEFHAHMLDRIMFQCFLKRNQLKVLRELYQVLNDVIIFGKLLDDYTVTDEANEEKLLMKCRRLYAQFQAHARIFVRILNSMEEKGYGRLINLLNNMETNLFSQLYARYEAKDELDLFVRDLSSRLSLNGFYNNPTS